MKITVDISTERDYKPDGPPAPTGINEAATEFLEWLHEASAAVEPPAWVGSFDGAVDDQPWVRA